MAAPPHRIDGTVRDSAGNTLAGARISLVEGPVSLPDIAALTSADGTFTLAAPVPGLYRISCYADGFAPQTISVAVGAPRNLPVHFRMSPEGGRG